MKIYTRTGDDGSTGLFGGERRSKDDPLVEAYGTIDELNAAVGVARSHGLLEDLEGMLAQVQSDLFVLGAEVACVPDKRDKLKIALLGAADVTRLENAIDSAEAALSPLKNFVLPAGSAGSAALHLARAVCRRAERRLLAAGPGAELRGDLLVYLNRLSDLLFVYARCANRAASVADVEWVSRSDG
jgi:cob(I)alamin adenosyltransferase